MNQAQEELIKKFVEQRDYFLHNLHLLERHSHLKKSFESFLSSLQLILKTLEIMEEKSQTLGAYNLLKEDLIRTALSVSRNVTAYSLLEELTDVQGMFCYTFEELTQESDDKILIKCRNLSQFIASFRIELIDYGITENIEKKLIHLTDQFQTLFESKKLHEESIVSSDIYITQLINETEILLKEKVLPVCDKLELKTH